jgi:hypothetical protein
MGDASILLSPVFWGCLVVAMRPRQQPRHFAFVIFFDPSHLYGGGCWPLGCYYTNPTAQLVASAVQRILVTRISRGIFSEYFYYITLTAKSQSITLAQRELFSTNRRAESVVSGRGILRPVFANTGSGGECSVEFHHAGR